MAKQQLGRMPSSRKAPSESQEISGVLGVACVGRRIELRHRMEMCDIISPAKLEVRSGDLEA